MRIWITKWALTVGILQAETDGSVPSEGVVLYRVPVSPQVSPGGKSPLWLTKDRDAFDTLEAAQADARMRFIGNEVVARRAHEKALILAQRAKEEPIQVFPLGCNLDLRKPFP